MSVDYSPERREEALAHLRAHEARLLPMSPRCRLLNAVALLVCDDDGYVLPSDLDEAFADPSARQAARALLAKAGL